MDLKTYIETIGDEKAAELFGVTVRTAASWRRGERSPRPKALPRIIKAARGKLSYESVYCAEARP